MPKRLCVRTSLPGLKIETRGTLVQCMVCGLALLEEDSVDVAFEVVDGDQRKTLREGQRLGVGNPHQQRPGQSRPGGHSNRVQIPQANPRLRQRRTHPLFVSRFQFTCSSTLGPLLRTARPP